MLHYFPHQAIDGSWHVVYRTPGCDSLTSMMAGCPTRDAANKEAQRFNADSKREHTQLQAQAEMRGTPGAFRPIPTGFYSDSDAA